MFWKREPKEKSPLQRVMGLCVWAGVMLGLSGVFVGAAIDEATEVLFPHTHVPTDPSWTGVAGWLFFAAIGAVAVHLLFRLIRREGRELAEAPADESLPAEEPVETSPPLTGMESVPRETLRTDR